MLVFDALQRAFGSGRFVDAIVAAECIGDVALPGMRRGVRRGEQSSGSGEHRKKSGGGKPFSHERTSYLLSLGFRRREVNPGSARADRLVVLERQLILRLRFCGEFFRVFWC